MENQLEPRIGFREFKAICRAITNYDDLDLLIHHIAEHICRFFEVKACSVLLFDEQEQQFFRVASYGISEEYDNKGPLPVDEKFSHTLIDQPVFIENMQNDTRVMYPEAARKEGLVSMLSVPITHRRSLLGIIRIYHGEIWYIHKDDLDAFCLLGQQLGVVVENNGLINFLDQVKHSMMNLPARILGGSFVNER